MTQVSIPGGFYYPGFPGFYGATAAHAVTLNGANLRVAQIGRVYWDGKPAAAKTISAAGGGSIAFRTGGVTFSNGSTSLSIGIQDVTTGAGPVGRPDDAFDVSRALTGGGGGISGSTWNSVTMTGGSGTKSVTDGDLIAVVWDMTARGGADSVVISAFDGASVGWGLGTSTFPTVNNYTGGAWGTTNISQFPNVLLTADDGTLGILGGMSIPISSSTQDTFADATNPDERGMQFQVPFDCKVNGFVAAVGITDGSSDFTLKLYSSPTDTPQLITSLAVAPETLGSTGGQRPGVFLLPAEQTLSRGTTYGVTVLATGSSNARLQSITLGNTNVMKFTPAGTSYAKISRDGSSGNFSAESPALTIYPVGVVVSSVDDGTGTGSGGNRFIGG